MKHVSCGVERCVIIIAESFVSSCDSNSGVRCDQEAETGSRNLHHMMPQLMYFAAVDWSWHVSLMRDKTFAHFFRDRFMKLFNHHLSLTRRIAKITEISVFAMSNHPIAGGAQNEEDELWLKVTMRRRQSWEKEKKRRNEKLSRKSRFQLLRIHVRLNFKEWLATPSKPKQEKKSFLFSDESIICFGGWKFSHQAMRFSVVYPLRKHASIDNKRVRAMAREERGAGGEWKIGNLVQLPRLRTLLKQNVDCPRTRTHHRQVKCKQIVW